MLARVARRGFELLENALTQAWDNGRPNASAAFENLGRAYLQFVRLEPAYYSAMFEAAIPLDTASDVTAATARTMIRGNR